jgi:F-type H+-transporting ATPase subunit delta
MAEPRDKQLELADVYAAALFELAAEAGVVGEVRDELEQLARLEQTEPDLAAMLTANVIDLEGRRGLLERMLRGKISDLVLDTIQVLSAHGRAHLLGSLARRFAVRQEHAAGEVEVLATTAVELAPAQRQQVLELAAQVSGKRPLLTCQVDAGILGGLVLEIEGYRYDCSLRRQLEMARTGMLERSERGLGIGAPG